MTQQTAELTDHDEIRESAGGGDDTGMIRLDFPEYSGENSLQEISRDDWFEKFDDSDLALLMQETTAGGAKSNFNKLVARK